MANVNVQPETERLYSHNYNPLTVASLDLGELLVSRRIECEKRDDWSSIKARGHLRMAALDFPAYGRAYIKSAAFFVPYYQILQNFNGIRSNMLVDKSQSCVMPHITTSTLNNMFIPSDTAHAELSTVKFHGTDLSQLPSGTTWQQCCIDEGASDTVDFYLFDLTQKGRRLYKFFKMLGYDFREYDRGTTFSVQDGKGFNINALSILAYCKIWTDYFLNIHMYNQDWLVGFLRAVKDGHDFTLSGVRFYNASTGLISDSAIWAIYNHIKVPFENNMLTNAWNAESSPLGISPNEASQSPHNVLSPHIPITSYNVSGSSSNVEESVSSTVNSVFLNSALINTPSSNPLQALSQLGLNSLYAIFEFVRRNNLFGSEAAKQAFARFGIKGDDYNTYFVRKLFEDSQQLDFSAVMSNSNTVSGQTGSVLGAYAGVGLGSMNFDYNYQCSDYGMIFNLNWIQINPLQLNGFDPSVLRFNAYDFYTPVFDGKAQRAVPNCEVATSGGYLRPANSPRDDAQIYGFVGIYDELRTMRDEVLGDFCIGAASNFLFARDMAVHRNLNTSFHPQTELIQYYNRNGQDDSLTDPFQYDVDNGDRFYLQFIWDISASRTIKSSSDSLMLNGEGDLPLSTDSNLTA